MLEVSDHRLDFSVITLKTSLVPRQQLSKFCSLLTHLVLLFPMLIGQHAERRKLPFLDLALGLELGLRLPQLAQLVGFFFVFLMAGSTRFE